MSFNYRIKKLKFDLDGNGKIEEIYFPAKGSGFLAIDLNEDGIINNGFELFGPATANGFEELAKYDEDSNRWIDESNSIFLKLKIWVKTLKKTVFYFPLKTSKYPLYILATYRFLTN